MKLSNPLLTEISELVGDTAYLRFRLWWEKYAQKDPEGLRAATDALKERLGKNEERGPVNNPGAWLRKTYQNLVEKRGEALA